MLIEAYCDGSCLGNPGPMGGGFIAVQFDTDPMWCTGSMSFGPGTSNLTELLAIHFMLTQVHIGGDDILVVHTDSRYAIDVIMGRKRYSQHGETIVKILNLIAGLDVRFKKVSGHTGVIGNEIADALAKDAARNQTATFDLGLGTRDIHRTVTE